MAEEELVPTGAFGGAITFVKPSRFIDVSDFRSVPDHQEVCVVVMCL